ncbi:MULTISPECIES: DUF3870 domain-containing protein [Halobacillus]|uniref:DUF3870 domain-containing protein n=2 Tax=Halobacillus TaxID=45667 RepID=I0JQW6_HALH3|nr:MULTISPECIES: DUF3870 domain-containing protein [Halobacillus]ASF40538.1 hypothetical protein CEH05_15815 [Halobacillus halophilus]MCA1010476.1 DUF3870 domain-containing protein [Halobacillus halophilus]CCG46536.1 hypothetical protein HBHAL_4194 [Halobacillus halophilus DSM 2266]SFG68729.1 protein of unknown function [Halobacillus alkaliphilus]
MNTLFVAGHSKLPTGMAANHISESLTLTLEVDKKYGVIVDASCTLATDHGREFIKSLLKGYSLKEGTDEPVARLKEGYLGKAGNALEAALKDSYKQYQLHQ